MAVLGLYSQDSIIFERVNWVAESARFHLCTVALSGPSLQALPLPVYGSLSRCFGSKSPPLYGSLGGSKHRELANHLPE